MLLNFVLTRVAGFTDEIALFTKLCYILDLIGAMKHGNMGLVGAFKRALLEYFEDIQRIYGSHIVIPKHHVGAMHLAKQFSDDGMVLDTLPVERLHQVPKGFGGVMKKLKGFDKFVLVRLIAHQRLHIQQFDERTRLLGASTGDDDLTLSRSMYVQGLTITVNDVVLLQTNVLAVVECCGKEDDAFFLLCTVCNRITERCGAATVRRQSREHRVWLHDTEVRDVKCWRQLANGDLEVLLPQA